MKYLIIFSFGNIDFTTDNEQKAIERYNELLEAYEFDKKPSLKPYLFKRMKPDE